MFELSARTVEQDDTGAQMIVERKAWPLTPGVEAVIQRKMPEDAAEPDPVTNLRIWAADWDNGISRERHVRLKWEGERLKVTVMPPEQTTPQRKKPPLWRDEQAVAETEVGADQEFWLGRTVFSVRPHDASMMRLEKTCSPEELGKTRMVCEADKLDALVELPELIRCSGDEAGLHEHVMRVLFDGIVHADQAAVVSHVPEGTPDNPVVKVHNFKQRGATRHEFRVSRRVIDRAMRQRQPYLHFYMGPGSSDGLNVTVLPATDWALCVPLMSEGYQHWGLYLAGKQPKGFATGEEGLNSVARSDLKFVQVVAETLGSVLQSRDLERRLSLIGRVLSPRVFAAIKQQEIETINDVLAERVVDVTVLFCDLRNSCRIVERGKQDLMGLWKQVSRVLDIMTRAIVTHQGVIGDFQGDAAMGFWGWPIDQPNQALLAARAALDIRRYIVGFNEASSAGGEEWACGIGLAHGQAVAGKLGAWDQFKVGVFGPVVNRAARLESFTKHAGVPILMDELTAAELQSAPGLEYRTRRLLRARMVGIDEPVTVHELLPATEFEPGPNLKEHDRLNHEAVLDAFFAGEWDRAERLLSRFEKSNAVRSMIERFISENASGPPSDWDGAITLTGK